MKPNWAGWRSRIDVVFCARNDDGDDVLWSVCDYLMMMMMMSSDDGDDDDDVVCMDLLVTFQVDGDTRDLDR